MTTTPTPKPTPKTVDLMIDIETMGNTPGCAILSIGAVFIKDGKLAEGFYQKVDLQSCLDVGLKMDASTVVWWMKQSDEARASITDEKGDHIIDVLGLFSRWAFAHGSGVGEVNVWGNAATFDVVLMEEAFRKTHINIPWEFWGHRCFRTLKNLCPSVPKPVFTGIKHHALDDAKHQALHMIAILEHINCLQNALDSATKPNTPNEQEKPTIQSPGFVATHTACTTGRFASKQDSGPAGEDGIPGPRQEFWGSADVGTPEDPAASVSGTP